MKPKTHRDTKSSLLPFHPSREFARDVARADSVDKIKDWMDGWMSPRYDVIVEDKQEKGGGDHGRRQRVQQQVEKLRSWSWFTTEGLQQTILRKEVKGPGPHVCQ